MIELKLGCKLQVIHIPGVVMILQGSDHLSQGIWMSKLQTRILQHRFLQRIFDPLPFNPLLVCNYMIHTTISSLT